MTSGPIALARESAARRKREADEARRERDINLGAWVILIPAGWIVLALIMMGLAWVWERIG